MTEYSDKEQLANLDELRDVRRAQLKDNALKLRNDLRPHNLAQRAQANAHSAIDVLTVDAIATAKKKPLAAITVCAMLAGAALFYPVKAILQTKRAFLPDAESEEDITGDEDE